ncbi:type II toxin-antitoxin system VapC family toxin [Rhodohalobacter sp.]|uniref:type II toxin-antitoxin system VapC family toxin n=1 Tax=Rhodohalobacter sp. TaxID=1974210 RepID=UPI002ACE680D|nr:type II toxin-antitoxin system VapC family toxin [Rhodohalobacter sp.]MDZ7757752.1 type II toxin-antitoxin system VapC family toxin [Rhodohalobacter sp.]
MIITIDTSALLAVLLNEPHKSSIVGLTKGHDLQAPASLDAEVGNALSAMFKRDRLSLAQAQQVLTQFSQIPIRRTKLRLPEAVEIANKHNIYAYDAYVLDCARQYRSPLLSLDSKLKAIGEKLELTLLEVSQ